jgi:hypothetical protein
MGPQGSDTFIGLLQACVDADGGIMFEPQDVLGVALKMRSAVFSQASAATLSFTSNQLSAVPEPVTDDQLIRNDVTVSRTNGSYAIATLVTGALSVNDPPNGVGDYPDTPTLNLHADSQLLDEASWRMHAGTINEDRWPVVTTGMHTNEMVANSTLAQQVQALDVGQVLTITGVPAALTAPDDTRQLIQGINETLSNFEFTIGFNCSPASAYDVVVLDDATFGRIDADSSTLTADITSSATSFQVTTAAGGAVWTTTDTPVTITIGGEQMTVGTITGTTSPQTFSNVTRSVNNVTKAHTAGDTVALARPLYLAI